MLKGRGSSTRLVVVGENQRSEEIERRRYQELGITKRINDLGIVSDAKLKQLYNHAAVLVFPSNYEGFGFPLLEAFACGCPVIASDIPTNREIGGKLARFFPTMDEGALADQIHYLGEHPPSPQEKQAYVEHARSFTWEAAAKMIIKLYEIISHDSLKKQ